MRSAKLIACLVILPAWATVALAATVQVGPTRTYTTVAAGYNAASPGDTIEIDSGTYSGISVCGVTITKDNLTIRGVGATRPVLDAQNSSVGGKGIFLVYANHVTVQNLEMKNCACSSANGAAVRFQPSTANTAASLTVQNCYLHDNQDGVLTDGDSTSAPNVSSTILFDSTEFSHNGAGDGQSHNLYVGAVTQFTMRYCWSHGSNGGHDVKTRAKINYILYNRLSDEGGNVGYECSACQGGTTYVIGNQIQQDPSSPNGNIIDYASEGMVNPDSHLYVINNTVVNTRSPGYFVHNYATVPAVLQNNIFQGPGPILTGLGTETTDWDTGTGSAYLVNPAIYDYHLTSNSTGAINMGTTPGTGINGFNMNPIYQYVHPCGNQARPVQGTIDIGAYEFLSSTNTPPVVDAGADQTIQFPAAATLAGSAIDDGLPTPPGMMTYTWTKTGGPGSVNFANANALSTTATFSVGGTYVLQLAAYDGALTGTDTVTITVNTAPTVHINAGPNWAYEDWPITLSCSASDADGDTLNYAWSQTSGVAMALAGAATSSVSFTTPHMLGTIHDASMSLRVTVSDGKGGTASDTTSLFVYMTGDINQDYNVNLGDLKQLIAAWNSTPTSGNWNAAADLDNSGAVILADLKLLIANWNRAMLP